MQLDEAVALDRDGDEDQFGSGVGRIGPGNEFGVIRHPVSVRVRGLCPVGGNGAEVIHFPSVGNAVVIHVDEDVVAGEIYRATSGQRVRPVVRGLIIRHVAELRDVLSGGQIADGDGRRGAGLDRDEADG